MYLIVCGGFCSDADLHMTALALELCCTMMVDKQHHANAGTAVRERVLPQALILVKSPLLQGQALQVPLQIFEQFSGDIIFFTYSTCSFDCYFE